MTEQEQFDLMYCWYCLYEQMIYSDCAKWDFLNFVRKKVTLKTKHQEFFQSYAKKHGLATGANRA